MSGPENGAVPTANDGDEQTIELAGEIKSIVPPSVDLPDPRVFIVADPGCPFSCSYSNGACPFRCAPLSVRDAEVPQ